MRPNLYKITTKYRGYTTDNVYDTLKEMEFLQTGYVCAYNIKDLLKEVYNVVQIEQIASDVIFIPATKV